MAEHEKLWRPAEAAQHLGVPASTLRRWSRRFAPFLSPQANGLREAPDAARGHRRYTAQDMQILARCKALLSQGLTFEQVTERLASEYQPQATVVEGVVESPSLDGPPGPGETSPEPFAPPAAEPATRTEESSSPVGEVLAHLLTTISGGQQMLLTGQQTERELLGILIQDNLNLKEENRRLRERMVETERRIFEMKREMDRQRDEERERMRQIEAHMFQLQRQMDDLVRRQRSLYPSAGAPVPPSAPPPPAIGTPPSPTQTASSSEPSGSSSEPSSTPPRKRSFWDRLLGRHS